MLLISEEGDRFLVSLFPALSIFSSRSYALFLRDFELCVLNWLLVQSFRHSFISKMRSLSASVLPLLAGLSLIYQTSARPLLQRDGKFVCFLVY
jgi:hypothetical protein